MESAYLPGSGTAFEDSTTDTNNQLKVYTTEAGSSSGATISLTKATLIAALNVNGTSGTTNQVNTTYAENDNLAATTASTTFISLFTVDEITNAIENVATLRATNGGLTSRLQFAQEQLQTNTANLEAANSRIIDVDVAKESTAFAKYNVLVQSISNGSPSQWTHRNRPAVTRIKSEDTQSLNN